MEIKLTTENLDGIYPPLVTPFDDKDEVDYELFSKEIEYHLTYDIKGLVVGGSTGEGYSLSDDELSNLCETAIKKVNNKIPIIAGIITNSTKDSVRKSLIAKERGVTGLMITPLHYFSTNKISSFNYYKDISDKVKLPIIIYNVVTNNPLKVDTLESIAAIENVIGIKQSIGDGSNSPDGQVVVLADLINKIGHKVSILSSYDPVIYPGLVLGARGSIGAINTILPQESVEIYRCTREQNHEDALKIFKKMFSVSRLLKKDNWPSWVKSCINIQKDRQVGYARKPMLPLKDKEIIEIKEVMNKVEII